MRDDRDEAWDSYPDDPFDGLDREDWDEEDWEEFLARQDVLTAKYQELFETLHGHPKRDELIAREMHWNFPENLAAGPPGGDELPEGEAEPGDGPTGAADEELAALPAYRLAQDFALAVDRYITARLRDRAATDEDACPASRAAIDVPAKIAGGHGMGYERDTLCGNIACCKQALASLGESLDALLALRERGTLPPAEADALLQRGRELGEAIAQRIEDLRLRVWWR